MLSVNLSIFSCSGIFRWHYCIWKLVYTAKLYSHGTLFSSYFLCLYAKLYIHKNESLGNIQWGTESSRINDTEQTGKNYKVHVQSFEQRFLTDTTKLCNQALLFSIRLYNN